MTWVKLDDKFFEHRKIRGLSKDAQLLFLASLTYAAGNQTDGALDAKAVRILMVMTDASNGAVQELSKVGLWDASNGAEDYLIHDYLDYNPSREEIALAKAKRQASGRAGGRASAQGKSKHKPVPVPVPVIDTVPGHSSAEAAELDEAAAAAFTAVQEVVGTLNAFSRAEVDAWLTEYPPEWIPSACEEAALSNVRNLKYIGAILQRWSEEGRFTAGEDDDTGETQEEWVARTKAEFAARGMM